MVVNFIVATAIIIRGSIQPTELEACTAMEKQKPDWFGMKVTPDQKRKIKHLAKKRGVSAKEAVMRLVEEALVDEKTIAPNGSFLSGIEDIVGSVEEPSDLSTNPIYLQGFGK